METCGSLAKQFSENEDVLELFAKAFQDLIVGKVSGLTCRMLRRSDLFVIEL